MGEGLASKMVASKSRQVHGETDRLRLLHRQLWPRIERPAHHVRSEFPVLECPTQDPTCQCAPSRIMCEGLWLARRPQGVSTRQGREPGRREMVTQRRRRVASRPPQGRPGRADRRPPGRMEKRRGRQLAPPSPRRTGCPGGENVKGGRMAVLPMAAAASNAASHESPPFAKSPRPSSSPWPPPPEPDPPDVSSMPRRWLIGPARRSPPHAARYAYGPGTQRDHLGVVC